MIIRQLSLVLLVGILVILTGLGGVAHALSNGCVGLHCEDHMQSAEHSTSVKTGSGVLVPGGHHDTEGSGAGECKPSLCQAVVLLPQNGEVAWNQCEIVTGIQIEALTKLTEPDSPYKPPDVLKQRKSSHT